MSTTSDWETRSFVIVAVGFMLVMFGLSGAGRDLAGAGGAVEALQICGFVCYLVCFVLVGLVKFGDLEKSEEVQYAYITAAFVSVLLIIIGLGVYGCKGGRRPTPYATAMLVCGALMATLGGSFGVLDVLDY